MGVFGGSLDERFLEPAECLCHCDGAVRDGVFFLGGEFGEGAGLAYREEDRVVAKATVAFGGEGEGAFAFSPRRRRVVCLRVQWRWRSGSGRRVPVPLFALPCGRGGAVGSPSRSLPARHSGPSRRPARHPEHPQPARSRQRAPMCRRPAKPSLLRPLRWRWP